MPVAGNIAVIVAAGKGTRMQSRKRKQYLELAGVPVLVHTLRAFDTHAGTCAMVLVVPGSEMAFCGQMILDRRLETPIHLVAGGVERQDSVENGLGFAEKLCSDPRQTFIMVHDGVRPFVSHEVMDNCLAKARDMGAAIPALQIVDTIKTVDGNGQILNTLDRRSLYRAQTPQTFRLDLGLAAFAHARRSNFRGTDEASVLEHMDIPVGIVPGTETNIKLTTPQDLDMAAWLLSRSKSHNTQ